MKDTKYYYISAAKHLKVYMCDIEAESYSVLYWLFGGDQSFVVGRQFSSDWLYYM